MGDAADSAQPTVEGVESETKALDTAEPTADVSPDQPPDMDASVGHAPTPAEEQDSVARVSSEVPSAKPVVSDGQVVPSEMAEAADDEPPEMAEATANDEPPEVAEATDKDEPPAADADAVNGGGNGEAADGGTAGDGDGRSGEGEDGGEDERVGEDLDQESEGANEVDKTPTDEHGSPRKESIRDRLRREGRGRARSENEDAAPDLRDLDTIGGDVKTPSASDIHIFAREDYPPSYTSNTPKEVQLIQHTQRFLAQYTHLYPDRKPPCLNPLNDCRLPKCASTFIRPTLLPYIDCYDWQGCAKFVADHLDYRPLQQPTEAPEIKISPATVLRYQTGNCFEYSTLLCSLLTGAGYRAYVVSGYAVRSVCQKDMVRVVCPEMTHVEEEATSEEAAPENKYQLKPPKELVSKYEAMMEERVREAARKLEQERLEEEIRQMNEHEKEPPDPLFGMRVHAWVLVMPGDRDITEPFFIEPSTGVGKGIRSPDYLGIESLWNHRNYWINLQYCINGVRDLEYDLFNPIHWEFLLLRDAMRTPHPDEVETDLEEAVLDADRLLEMPFSWVERLQVSKARYDERFPCGKKVTNFYRSKVEEFSPYSMKDGVVKRLTMYEDFGCETVVSVKETYLHRADHLVSREITQETGWVEERFSAGREDALKEHQYAVLGNNPEDRRVMQYYHKARKDCMATRTVTEGGVIQEDFIERDDKLYRRETLVGSIQKKFGPACATRKPIISITERMHRNPRGDGDDGVSLRTFDIADAKISVVFHACRGKITAERREFSKPHPDDKARLVPILEEAAASGFSTDPEEVPPRMLDLYYMMKAQMEDEERSVAAVREAEDEIIELLNARLQEEAALDMEYSLFDSDLQPQIRTDRKDLEAFLAAQSTRLVEKNKDPLGPFLARLNATEAELTTANRFQLRDECMQSFRQRLVDKANRLQKQFEEETEALQSRQRWYQQNYVGLTDEEEERYLTFCHDTMFRLHVLELLLERHKQMAPVKHQALEMKLRSDPRISGDVIKEEGEGGS
ncbi:dynein regulatory complex subunit 7-like [Pollicipes pollicipes]|uniref:dynein regulatory complex subunit 7-like n=1 Tax=Pollicipes pollicipes TaxID=41117 RepID=UPI001884909B|nr:dynein regulatory complex subunit 7-like [Pollicipes pollicipes]